MSETSSLYMRVTMSLQALHAFKGSAPADPGQYADWQAWLRAMSFYGTISDADIAQVRHRSATVGAYLEAIMGGAFAVPAFEGYDPAHERWTLCVVGLSENYHDFLEVLSVVRAAARYKDRPGDDFILIYPYLWEEQAERFANAYVLVEPGASLFALDIPAAAAAEASGALAALIAASHADEADR